jgi:hypothetical protein
MRLLWLTLLLTALPARAWAQAVTLAELQGAVIEVTIEYEVVGQRNGRPFSGRSQDHRKIVIGPGDTEHDVDTTTWFSARGPRVSAPRSGSSNLGQPKVARALGGGHRLLLYESGVLTLMRTFKVGGYKTEIRLARGAEGFTCAATAPMMHESGTDNTRLDSAFGGEVEILSQKQISSSCRITMHN